MTHQASLKAALGQLHPGGILGDCWGGAVWEIGRRRDDKQVTWRRLKGRDDDDDDDYYCVGGAP